MTKVVNFKKVGRYEKSTYNFPDNHVIPYSRIKL